RGSEKRRWGNRGTELATTLDVEKLPAGHAIDLDCPVRFGVIGEPAPADQVSPDAPEGASGAAAPDQERRQLADFLGPTFLIFRDNVQEELQLSRKQKEELQSRLATTIQAARAFFDKL